jgi:hypothetical protein
LENLLGEANAGRLRRLALSDGLHGLEVCDVGCGLQNADANQGRLDECFCGAVIDNKGVHDHIVTCHMEITA